MYSLNALHLKQFYASDLGELTRAYLQTHMAKMWPRNDDDTQLALGYPTVLWRKEHIPKNLILVMPAEQGAVRWPRHEANKTIVSRDADLPVPGNTINRVILLHSLEFSPHISELMKEVYRVLVPNGRVMIIAPNRLGLWARSSQSPFGYGRPFSTAEIKSLLEDTGFTFRRHRTTLFMPPTHRRLLLKASKVVEFFGQFFLPMCGGVHMVEAEKQIYSGVMQPIRNTVRKTIKAPVAAVPTQMNRE